MSASFLLHYVLTYHDFVSAYAHVNEVYWKPVSFFSFFEFSFFSESLLDFFRTALICLLILSVLGLFTRVSLIGVSIILTLYMGYEINFYKPKMFQAIFIFVFWILAFSRCSDKFSLDRRFFLRNKEVPIRSWVYGWPIRFVGSIMVYLYLSAGFLKVFHSGSYWFLSDNLAFIFVYLNQPLGIYIGHNFPLLCKILAFTVISFELMWVVYFFRPKLSQWLLIPSLLLHLGSFYILGLVFLPFAFFHIFLFDWGNLLNKLKFKSFGAERVVVEKPYVKSKTFTVHCCVVIFLLGMFLTESLGHPNKPFNWPFVSFSMFASPYLIDNSDFSNVEVKMVLNGGKEVLPNSDFSRPFSTKHFREIFNKLHRSGQIEKIKIALLDAINRYKGDLNIEGVVIYKVQWKDIDIESFSREQPSFATEVFRLNLKESGSL